MPVPGGGRGADRGRGRRRQPARRAAAQGRISAAAGRLGHSRARGRRPRRGGRPRRQHAQARATRSARSSPAAAMPTIASRPSRNACRCRKGFRMVEAAALPGDLLHRVAQSLRARPARRGRERAGPWRLERHRHDRDAAGARVRRAARSSPPPAAPTNAAPARSSGATRAIDYKHEDFVKVVKDATGGRGVDVVLDMVGGDYIQRNLVRARAGRAAGLHRLPRRRHGRGEFRAGHAEAPHHHRLDACARARSRRRARSPRRSLREVWPLLDAGKVKPVIHRTFPLAEAAAAHRADGELGAYRQDRAHGLTARGRT